MNPLSYWKSKSPHQSAQRTTKTKSPAYEIKMVVCPRCGEQINLKRYTDWIAKENLETMKEVM